MPTSFTEHITDIYSHERSEVELSPYQAHLNAIYVIISPVLENIYNIRYPSKSEHAKMVQILQQTDRNLHQWQQDLPSRLALEQCSDPDETSPLEQKVHALQALSLHLTHLNLVIVVHRPMLATWKQQNPQSKRDLPTISSRAAQLDAYEKSLQRCIGAALTLSRLGHEKPNLFLLASRTHLLSFLAMNIFTSSVVLFLCASSDVLSNTAQEAKRGLSRNLRMLRSLPHAGSLSKQCGDIVSDLIHLVLAAEKEELFEGAADSMITSSTTHGNQTSTLLGDSTKADRSRNDTDTTPAPMLSSEYQANSRHHLAPDAALDRTMNKLNRGKSFLIRD